QLGGTGGLGGRDEAVDGARLRHQERQREGAEATRLGVAGACAHLLVDAERGTTESLRRRWIRHLERDERDGCQGGCCCHAGDANYDGRPGASRFLTDLFVDAAAG